MENLLVAFIFVFGIIIITSIINERKFHISKEIALLIGSFLISIIIILVDKFGIFKESNEIIINLKKARLDTFLLETTLCFMLFASSSKIRLNKFVKNIAPIGALAVVSTLVSSLFYGVVFFLISKLLKFNINIWVCMLLGSIISPTDPIAATSILNKLGMSKSVTSVIEGEALFNDGIAVALFVFFKNIVEKGTGGNILILMFKEIFGAILIGFAISFILFKLIKKTNEPIMHILISLVNVSLAYVLCEELGFSGVIASVVCGMYYSYQNQKIERWKVVVDSKELYKDFWNILEELLNSILFVLVGLSVISMSFKEINLLIIPLVIILNGLSRFIGVYVASKLVGEKNLPGKYTIKEFASILTVCGLKGGLSLALMITAQKILLPNTYIILIDTIMITILFTTIVQGLLIERVYKNIENKKEENIKSLKII